MHGVPREAVLVHLVGGLGNQMFQYAAVGAAASRAGRPLYLDAGDLPQQRSGLEVFPVHATLLTGRARWAAPRPGARALWSRRRIGTHRVLEQRFGLGNQLDSLPPRAWVSGYWQSPYYFSDWRAHLTSTFHVDAVDLSPRSAQLLAEVRAAPTVAVHVRRGDYVQDPATAAAHGVLEPSYFRDAVHAALDGTDAQVLVFSNDPAWCREQLRLPGARYVEPGPQAQAHEDLLVMTACRRHVLSNSSYSWWGAWLADSERVVAPKKWTIDDRYDTSTLIPDDWLRI